MGKQKYTINCSAFSSLNFEALYWLGFIYGDGCVYSRRGETEKQLRVKLQRKDEYHLYKLRSFLGFNGPVNRPASDVSDLAVYSHALFDALVQLGVRPNKTRVGVDVIHVAGSKSLPLAQGMFDANGSLSKDAYGLKVGISGPCGMPQWFREQVATHVSAAKKGHSHTDGPCHIHVWHGDDQCLAIMHWLFRNTNVPRLQRKVDFYVSHTGGAL